METSTYIVLHSPIYNSDFDKECINIRRGSAIVHEGGRIVDTMLYSEQDAKDFVDLIIKYGGRLYKRERENGNIKYTKM